MFKLFDFQCPFCQAQSEHLVKATEPAPKCETCDIDLIRTLPVGKAPGAQFGPGFAQDGYCSVTPTYKENIRKMKNAVSGRYQPNGSKIKSGLRGEF